MNFNKKLWKPLLKYGNIVFITENKNDIIGSGRMKYSFNKVGVSDGIELCNIAAEGFKSACVTVSFVLPLGEKASLYALVPNVLTRSSAKYPDVTSIERKLALLYGAELVADITKSGDCQVLKIGVSCIDDRFAFDGESITAECCELLFELIFNPRIVDGAFSPEEVASEKRLLAERLAAEMSDKRAYAKNRCEEIMFADEIYGIHRLGTAEAINEITPVALYNAYLEILSTSKIVVCASGKADFEAVKSLTAAYTEKLQRKTCKVATLYTPKAMEIKYEKEQENVKQGKLVMGFRLGMSDAEDLSAARRIMVDLFGGSPHSKLFTVVREKMSLCYYCSARMIRQKGVMFVQSGIESYNEEKAKNAILAQLEEIKNGNFSDEELENSVKALEDSFKSVSDSPEALDSWFMMQCVSGAYRYPEDFIEQFKKVTRDDVIKAARDVTLDTVFMLEGTAEGGESDE